MNRLFKFNFRSLSGFTSLHATIILLSFLLMSARFAKTNFSGDWTLSKEKSKIATGQMRIVYSQIKVTQTPNDITVVRTGEGQGGQEFTMEEKITLDGKESENSFFDGMVKKKSTAKWSTDEKVMTLTSAITVNRDGNEMKINVTEVWDLTQTPNALTVNLTSSSSNGETKDTYVYEKK